MTIIYFGRVVLILDVIFCIFLCSCSKPEEMLKPEEVFYYHIKDDCPGCQSHASIHVYTMVAKSPKPGLMTKGMKGTGRYIGPIIRRDGETYSIFPQKTIQVIDDQTNG